MGLASVVVLVILLVRLPKEEKLIERFGDEYRAYMKRTWRLLPHIKRSSAQPLSYRQRGTLRAASLPSGLSVVRRSLVSYTSCVSFLATIFDR